MGDIQDTYAIEREVKDTVEVFPKEGVISFVKSDTRSTDREPDSSIPHEDVIAGFMKDKKIEVDSNSVKVGYIYRPDKEASLIMGSLVYAGKDFKPCIFLQKSECGRSTPVFVLQVNSLNSASSVELSVKNSGRDWETREVDIGITESSLNQKINRLLARNSKGSRFFPEEEEDPFFILSKQLGLI